MSEGRGKETAGGTATGKMKETPKVVGLPSLRQLHPSVTPYNVPLGFKFSAAKRANSLISCRNNLVVRGYRLQKTYQSAHSITYGWRVCSSKPPCRSL